MAALSLSHLQFYSQLSHRSASGLPAMRLAKGPVVSLLIGLRTGGSTIPYPYIQERRLLSSSVVQSIHSLTIRFPQPLQTRNALRHTSVLPFYAGASFSRNGAPSHLTNRRFSVLIFAGINSLFGPRRLSPQKAVQTCGISYRHFHVSHPRAYDRLQNLEDAANRDRDNANAQAIFLQALLDKHPDYVVKRYESGGVATNAECDAIYAQALEKLGRRSPSAYGYRADNSIPHSSVSAAQGNAEVPRLAVPQDIARRAFAGMKGNPVHVVVDEGPSSTLLKWIRFILSFGLTAFFVFFLVSIMEETTGVLKSMPAHGEIKSTPTGPPVKFSDVKGVDEAKEDLEEVVMFLKDPGKFTSLGGKLPKGILLTGPPGTGKTMLARAVAGEAGVPFFFMSGSEFDEMYVGVGAKRMRDLFASARAKAPAIVFIDEIDAVGSRRNPRDQHYMKQTLNQLLVELDGFQQSSGIVVIAATNFPQLLDKALVRPGRFDKTVAVPLPDVRGRLQILEEHAKNIAIGPDVDFKIIARSTTGFSGADLANLVNQAAVKGSRERARAVTMSHFDWANDKIVMGAARPSAMRKLEDKIRVAYHEGGHALVALLTKGCEDIEKATILPRGFALGFVRYLPGMDKINRSRMQLIGHMDTAVAGRIAEEIVYGAENAETGASSDFQNLMRTAKDFVMRYGFSEKVGYYFVQDDEYSQLSAEQRTFIDREVRSLIEQSTSRVRMLLETHRTELERIKDALIEYETVTGEELKKIIKGERIRSEQKS